MEIEVIQDPETKSHYYAVYKSEYDGDDERTIIAYAETEIEALKMASKNIINALEHCQKVLEGIKTTLLETNEECYLPDKFYVKNISVKKFCDFGEGMTHDSFCALSFDKEHGWVRYYR